MTPSILSASPSWQEPLPKREDFPKAGEYRPAEGAEAFAAFCRYRDQGHDRSVARVGQELVKSRTLISRWSALYEWVERVGAYDLHRAEEQRKAAEADHAAKIAAYRDQAAKIGSATASVALGFLTAAGKRLQLLSRENPPEGEEGIKDIPIKQLPGFLRAAASVAETSLRVQREALGITELENLLGNDEDAAEGAG